VNYARDQIEIVLADAERVRQRLREIGEQISADYADRQLHLVAVLRGSIVVVADLLRELPNRVTVDFIAVASYGPRERHRGVVRVIKDLDQPIEGRDVLVVEDVIDTGLTLNYILRILKSRQPASLAIATLVDKPAHRLIDLPIRYVGFTVPDVFVVGYGLDYQERYRNLPFLATLKPPASPQVKV
jgi:hypoxanthine phosphoribosyltransferase